MQRSLAYRRSRLTLVIVVVALPALALLLPTAWTGKLFSLVQFIVPFQSASTVAVDAVGSTFDGPNNAVTFETFEQLRREKTALLHRTAALGVRVAELEREVEILAATRMWSTDGRRLGVRGKLIPADVLVADMLPWRSSRLVTAGSLQGVRSGSAVVSRYFTIDRGDSSGVQGGMAILLGETLVGLVDQVGTHTARARLLDDVSVQMKVRIGRFTDDGFAPLERYFWLKGRGQGIMEIRDAERRDVDAGVIQIGDTVLSDPTSGMLPAAMTVGTITAIDSDRKNPLLSILTVKGPIAPSDLRRVYVYDPPPAIDAKSSGESQ